MSNYSFNQSRGAWPNVEFTLLTRTAGDDRRNERRDIRQRYVAIVVRIGTRVGRSTEQFASKRLHIETVQFTVTVYVTGTSRATNRTEFFDKRAWISNVTI